MKLWNSGNILKQNANGLHYVLPDVGSPEASGMGEHGRKKITQKEAIASLIQFNCSFFFVFFLTFVDFWLKLLQHLMKQVEAHSVLKSL